ncbi:MAG: sigma-54-dependent transcriptional regulator [Verrucomicrobium sp.]
MREINRMMARVTHYNCQVLIKGAFGTGKQHLARMLHDDGPRKNGPFRVIHCSTTPPEALQEMIFGDEGDSDLSRSVFAKANGGTVHLAEIYELPMHLQARLLTVFDAEHAALGKTADEPGLDFRLVCSTTKDLSDLVRRGAFLQELYYRISVVTLDLPVLRDRLEDLADLAGQFLLTQAARMRLQPARLSVAAQKAMLKYWWPGNLAELRHAIEHGCAVCREGVIEAQDLPARVLHNTDVAGEDVFARPLHSKPESAMPIGVTLEEFVDEQSKVFVHETLKYNQGSREKTTQMLGISVSTLYRKLGLRGRHTSV